jgi:3-methyladenine DNA glycosylase AlkD
VQELFSELIQSDEHKFIHLNWYLREWSVRRMEKASPVMTIDEVKRLLKRDAA